MWYSPPRALTTPSGPAPTGNAGDDLSRRIASLAQEIEAIEQAIKAFSEAHDQLARLQSEIETLSRLAEVAPSVRPASAEPTSAGHGEAPSASARPSSVAEARTSTGGPHQLTSLAVLVALLTLAVWLVVGLQIALLLTLQRPVQPQQAVSTEPLVAPGPSPTVVLPTQTRIRPTPNPATPTAAPDGEPAEQDQAAEAEPPEPGAPIAVPEIEPAIGAAVIRPPGGFATARIRERPSTSARIVTTLPTGTRVELLEGSTRAEFLWLRVRTDEGELGWIVSTALQRVG